MSECRQLQRDLDAVGGPWVPVSVRMPDISGWYLLTMVRDGRRVVRVRWHNASSRAFEAGTVAWKRPVPEYEG